MYEKYEVVISGVAGGFPECSNFAELEASSMQGQNLVTLDDRKWTPGAMNVPSEIGKLKDCFKFDQSFFGIHRKLCRVMDAHAQQSLERTYEAIYDAGVRPESLSGSKTAVIMSSMTSESEYGGVMVTKTSGHAMLGHSRCMQSNRISYYFNFKGPSFAVDCSWVGGLQALVHAQSLIANGLVDAAVVGATNLVLAPEVSVHYDGLQRLSHDGHTKSFSDDAEGYCRSDGIVVFFLQRAEDANRSYGSIVKVICSSNMEQENFVFSDYSGFDKFLEEFYSDLDIDYNQIGYIEADGCAALKTDAMELNCLSGVLGRERTRPLLVGSCKSRLGHTESASAFVSMASALLALKTGVIPPTISYSEPNRYVPDLFNGKLKVVTERTPLEGDFVAVNVFGVVSAYGHVLLRRNPHSRPLLKAFPSDNLPRLLLLSGRDEQAMRTKFTQVAAKPVDEHFFAMNHKLHMQNYSKHLFRGYAIVGPNDSESDVMIYDGGAKRPVWFVFSGMGSQWNEMGKRLLDVPVTAASIHRSHELLLSKDIDLIGLITDPDPHVYDNILCAFVGIAAIQVALVDMLTALGITPDGIVGHSVGELGCSYADGCLTAEQVVLAAYARGKASNDAELIKGMMAAVGKGYKEIKDSLPDGVEVACHNSSTSCTLSGPADIMESYVEQLKNQGVFARLVNVANIAYHSKHIAPAAPFLLKSLKEIIPEPKQRSAKWVSSSVAEANWGEEAAKYCSAEYHTNNLLSYVLFEEASRHVPRDAICIEIAPHGLLQPILKRSLATCTNVALTSRTAKDNFSFLLKSLATLYLNGVEMNLATLYPPVEFPVPRETDFLHPLITWEHSEPWVPMSLLNVVASKLPSTCWIDQHLAPEDVDTVDFRDNHKINFVGTIPAAHCLLTVVEFVRNKIESSHPAVTFQNLKFMKLIPVSATKETQVQYLIQAGFGEFEVLYNREAYISGQAQISKPKYKYVKPELQEVAVIEGEQIYDFLAKCGFCLSSEFNNIVRISVCSKGFTALLSWKGNFKCYLDGVFNLLVFYHSLEGEHVKEIDSVEYMDVMESAIPEDVGEEIEVTYNAITGELYGLGVRMLRIKMRKFIENDNSITSIYKKEFVPHGNYNMKDGFLDLCVSCILDNTFGVPLSTSITLIALDEKLNPKISEIKDLIISYSEVQVEVRKPIMEEMETAFELKALKGVSEHLVLVCCGDLEGAEKKAAQLPEHIPCFVLDLDYKPGLVSSSLLAIVYNTHPSNNIALLKKSTSEGKGDHFVLMPKSDISELVEENLKEKKHKRLFMVFYYSLLSDITETLQLLSSLRDRKELRVMFLEDGGAKWELESPQYLSQARKDLRVSVGRAGSWGSLLEVPLMSPQTPPSLELLTAPSKPLNNIRCKEIEIVNLSFNLEQLVLPSLSELKVGLVEYSGLKNGQAVLGLGRLDQDYILHPDPVLCWRKPEKWTFQQAATVPLFYSMSYLMLVLLTKYMKEKVDSLLIHSGHSCFAQAVINVALSKKIRIITTCFNKEQKEFIKSKYPQINDADIFIMDKALKQRLDIEVMKVTNWEGVMVVINTLNNPELLNVTVECTSNSGRYFQISNKTMNIEQKLGMGVFMREYSVRGINPDNICDLENELKENLAQSVEGGLKSQTVVPLDSLLLKSPVNPEQAALTIMNSAALGVTRKLIIPVSSETPVVNGTSEKQKLFQVDANKRYLIIGGARDLWFDLITWLVAKGADKLFVIIDESQISRTIQRKLNSFMVKHKSITVHLLPSKYIESAEACEKLMAKLDNGLSGNTGTATPLFTFYITQGMEKELEQVDVMLRKYSKDCGLVCLGLGADRVVELRQKQGLHGVCITPKRTNIRNRPLLNVLDKVLATVEPSNFVTFDHMPKKDGEEGGTRDDSVLPGSVEELVAIGDTVDDCARLVELPTQCLPAARAKGIQAVVIIPGFKTRRLIRLASKLLCPAFLVQLPGRIKSIEAVIPSILKVLAQQFEEGLLTLVGESWSGAVCLMLARYMEEAGRKVEILLLEAAPYTVRQWINTSANNSFVTKYFPITEKDDVEQVKKLDKVCVLLSEMISRGEGVDESAIRTGLVGLLSRLSALTTFSMKNYTLDAKVHLFRPTGSPTGDTCQLEKCCERPVVVHVMDEASLDSMLDSDNIVKTINDLVLLEYKYTARPQKLEDIATTELILDAIYQTEGLTRH